MKVPLWRLRDVMLTGRTRPRLDHITLEIPQGVCALAGESGAGKTSLLNLLVEYEKPDSGELERIPANRSTTQHVLPVYWAPPDDGLWPHMTVREHIEAVVPAGDRQAAARRTTEVLEAFHLLELAAVRPAVLSEGERSRLSAARALASRAQVLVMDEPLAHVNRALARDCWDAIRAACHGGEASLVFSSHDPESILREAAHVICLEQGRVEWSGPVSELYDRPPSRRLAEVLGPVNWFEPHESAVWLQVNLQTPRGVRPERMDLKADSGSSLVVEHVLPGGPICETTVRDESSGACRTFVHRCATAALRRGMRVAVSAILTLLAAVVLAGCDDSAEDPALPVSHVRTWALPVEEGFLPAPRAATFDKEGTLYVLDDIGRVVVFGADGQYARSWWMPEYAIGRPEGIAVLSDGRLAVADTHYHRIVFFSPTGTLLGMFGTEGERPGEFIFPCDVAEDAQGNLYVSEYGGNDRVQKFTAAGEFLLEFGEPGTAAGQFQRMAGLAWHDGKVYVADSINNRVQAFSDDGKLLGVLTDARIAPLEYPYDLTILPDGRIYVVEYKSGRVTCLSPDGELLGRYGSTGRSGGEFWTPWGLAVHPDGRILVADTGNRRLVELTP